MSRKCAYPCAHCGKPFAHPALKLMRDDARQMKTCSKCGHVTHPPDVTAELGSLLRGDDVTCPHCGETNYPDWLGSELEKETQ